MKSIIFSSVAVLFAAFITKAQLVTISPTHQMPVAGDSIHYVDANTFGFDANGTGPVTSKVWNFSSLMNTGSTVDFVYVNPSTLQSSDGIDSFPTANIARRQSDAAGYFYYENTSNNINRIGFYINPSTHGIYKDGTKGTEFHFPITAGGNFTSSYHGRFAPFNVGEDSVTIENGTITINADMQGQLITPTITFNNALRLHVVESFHMKAYMIGMAITDNVFTDDYYYWFVDTILQPVVIYGISSTDGNPEQPVLRYQPLDNTSNLTNFISSDNIKIYPVPSHGSFIVNIGKDAGKLNKIEVLNSVGQIVLTKSNTDSGQFQINLSQYAKGEYFVKLCFEENEIVRKINIY